MFTIMLSRQQLDELYYEGPEATSHLIEGLLKELADFEQILGERQQRVIDAQYERNERPGRDAAPGGVARPPAS